jgi:hypothetical protein
MKTYIKILIIVFSVLCVLPSRSNAQNSLLTRQKNGVLKRIDSVIQKGFKDAFLKDSIGLYAVNFRLEITGKKGNKTLVTQIHANDSIAYRLFPSYKRLYSIDYSSIIGARKKITLIIPVLISNVSATAEKRYKKDDGSHIIGMDAAVNAAFALYSTIPYDNVNEAKVPVGHRLYKSMNHENEERINTDVVFLTPYLIDVLNIR